MSSPLISTERALIRKFNLDDAGFIVELLNSRGWLKYIGDRNITSVEAAKNYLANGPLLSYTKYGFGPYLVELKSSGEPIGMCSLIKRDGLEDVDIGFAFLDVFAQKGFAYEVSKALLSFAFHQLKLKRIVAITMASNPASILLIQKLGLRFDKTVRFPGDSEELLHYSIEAPEI